MARMVEQAEDSYQFFQADTRLYTEHVKDLVEHSSASIPEINFLLAITDTDPLPEHQIIFTSSASVDSQLL